MTTNITRLDIFRNLVDALGVFIKVDNHHREYVASAVGSQTEAIDELDGALSLAIEQNDRPAITAFSGIRGTIGRGTFPPGQWGNIVAEYCFAYVNKFYCDLATRERAGTCLDWGTF